MPIIRKGMKIWLIAITVLQEITVILKIFALLKTIQITT